MDTPADVFRGITDRFAGVTVDGREENVDKSSFRDKLTSKNIYLKICRYLCLDVYFLYHCIF